MGPDHAGSTGCCWPVWTGAWAPAPRGSGHRGRSQGWQKLRVRGCEDRGLSRPIGRKSSGRASSPLAVAVDVALAAGQAGRLTGGRGLRCSSSNTTAGNGRGGGGGRTRGRRGELRTGGSVALPEGCGLGRRGGQLLRAKESSQCASPWRGKRGGRATPESVRPPGCQAPCQSVSHCCVTSSPRGRRQGAFPPHSRV